MVSQACRANLRRPSLCDRRGLPAATDMAEGRLFPQGLDLRRPGLEPVRRPAHQELGKFASAWHPTGGHGDTHGMNGAKVDRAVQQPSPSISPAPHPRQTSQWAHPLGESILPRTHRPPSTSIEKEAAKAYVRGFYKKI